MALSLTNEYRALAEDGSEKVICADKLSNAAVALETGDAVLTQISILRKNVNVETPDVMARFTVTVSPEAAATAGCIALPETFVVAVGSNVILEARLPPLGGYTFLGWYRGEALVSSDLIASVAIQAPASGAIADEIVAKFQLTT